MHKITFKGTESERAVFSPPSLSGSIKRALDARGYEAHMNSSETNPWWEIPAPDQMFAVQGKLTLDEKDGLLLMADSQATLDDAWEAIRLLFPKAKPQPIQTINRPA